MSITETETVHIYLDECINADDAIVMIELMIKGYKPQKGKRTEYWNYELQTAMKVRDGKLFIKSKESSGWDETDVSSLPEAMEQQIGDIIGPNGKVVR